MMIARFLIVLFCLVSLNMAYASSDDSHPPELITVANAASVKQWRTVVSNETGGIAMQEITFSPNGEFLAAVQREYDRSFDGVVRLWDTKSWNESHTFADSPVEAMAISFNPDNTFLVTGDSSGTIVFSNLLTRKQETTVKADRSHVNSIAISPNESIIAIAGSDLGIAEGKIAFTLINFISGDTLGQLATCTDELCPGPAFATAFDPTGNIVAFASTTNGTVRIWDSKSGEELASIEKAVFWVNHMVFTPDGNSLIYAATDGIRVWNIKSVLQKDGNKDDFRVFATPAEGEFIQSIALNPGGTVLAVGYLDSTIKLWNLATGEQLTVLEGHKDRVVSLAFSPDGTLLASGGTDGTVRLWGVPES